MKLYRCLWPDGDVSFVLALSKRHAVDALDERAGVPERADSRMLSEVTDEFMVHLTATVCEAHDPPEVHWHLDSIGDATLDLLEDTEDAILEDHEDMRPLPDSQRRAGRTVN